MAPAIPRKRTGYQLMVTALLALFLLIAATLLLEPPAPGTEIERLIEIPPAATASDVTKLLYEEGLIKHELVFRLLGKINGQENTIKAGRYRLASSQKPWEILQILTEGHTVNQEIRVTIPEGYTVRQTARLLTDRGLTTEDEFLALAKDGKLESTYFCEAAPESADWQWEGFFFPDTYFLLPDATAKDIAQTMLCRMDEIWAEEVEALMDLPAQLTPREFVTLASLVEREAKVAEERPLIAAVFYNRLDKGMPLGSCASVQYLFSQPKPELSWQDTRIPSPYNTYLHLGLPPGPVAAPGRAAIRAVLKPSNSDKLYFVAKSDGSHAFSHTYEEHLQNQRKYLSQ
jgi:UPF0755 protein